MFLSQYIGARIRPTHGPPNIISSTGIRLCDKLGVLLYLTCSGGFDCFEKDDFFCYSIVQNSRVKPRGGGGVCVPVSSHV